MSAFYISAAHKSSGKTMLSMGLAAAFKSRGLSVQSFKKGPDYIDPIWLALASGKPCHNLDFHTASSAFIQSQYQQYGASKDVVLVEGNKGLYDGVAVDGSDSNAAMAKLLNLPVILVIDTVGMTRGIAPLLCGYQAFDSKINIAGVILNKVGGSRHTGKLINAIAQYTDIPVLGAIERDSDLALCERHLGLVPGNEMGEAASQLIACWRDRVVENVDLDRVFAAGSARKIPAPVLTPLAVPKRTQIRIAIAQDAVFGFYYSADLARFRALGVDLVNFDTTVDHCLPEDIDGLFIGGGFPETNLPLIAGNSALLADVKEKILAGLPTYAECGGLMYLSRSIEFKGESQTMAGVIAADIKVHDKPQGRGYVRLRPTAKHPWCEQASITSINAHEFHYSTLYNCKDDFEFAYLVDRGQGIDGCNDGIIFRNLLASYCHLRQTDLCPWVDQFVDFVASCKTVASQPSEQNDYSQPKSRQSN